MSVIIREAGAEDHEVLLHLYYGFYRELRSKQGWSTGSPEDYRDDVTRHLAEDKVFLAFKDGIPAGFARVSRRDGSYWIEELYVEPENRGHGIAKQLLRIVEEYVSGRDDMVYIMVTPQDERALGFWLHMGYTILNTIELAKTLESEFIPGKMFRTVEFLGHLFDAWKWRNEEYPPELKEFLEALEEYRKLGGSRRELLLAFTKTVRELAEKRKAGENRVIE